MATTLHLRVLTPDRMVVDTEVDEVTAPGSVGEMGVLPDHITFLGTLDAGELRYRAARTTGGLAIAGGFVEVANNEVTVLADAAVAPGDVDPEAARRDLAEAEARLGALDPYGDAYAEAEAARRWAAFRLELAGRR
jgi:F-type H+-transporting ATPase subunit epsilon